MTSKLYADGDVIDYTCTGTVTVGDELVLGAAGNVCVGIALKSGVSGDVIGVAIGGVFTMPKTSGAVIAQGETVDWDVSAGSVDDNAATSATGDVSDFGIATEAAGSGTTTVTVLLLPGNGAIH